MGQTRSGFGQAVEIILALAARGDDPAVPQKREVMADGGLALAQLGAQRSHVPLAFGKNQDDLKSRRVADVLEQDRCCDEPGDIAARLREEPSVSPQPTWRQGNSLRWS